MEFSPDLTYIFWSATVEDNVCRKKKSYDVPWQMIVIWPSLI
jgi:hypothetical protein